MADNFESLGREGALRALYEKSGYRPSTSPSFECREAYSTTSSRMLLEGIDFDLSFFPFKYLGRKAVIEATGELFACLASPRVLKVTIGVSSKLDFPEISEIWEGIYTTAREFGYTDLSLELTPSLTGLAISVAASGLAPLKQAASRPIAKSMDLICLSNNAGAAFLGEQILSRGKDMDEGKRQEMFEKNRRLIGAYLRPELSPATLDALDSSGIIPSFGFFLHDSLRDALLALGRSSGLGLKVYVDKLPLAGGSVDAAKEIGVDPLQAALKGGDDNCLLFTIPIGCHDKFRRDFQEWDVIGHLAKPEVGAVLVSPDGLEHEI